MESYDEAEWRGRVDAALGRIRTILDNTRNPQYAAEVPHRYDDKYLLAEFLARVSMASWLSCLASIGLAPEGLAELHDWAKTRAVSLRFTAREDCTFLREETRKVEFAHQIVTERSFLGSKSERTEKIVTTVMEYFWAFDFAYELVAFRGASPDEGFVSLLARSGSIEIKTAAKSTPRPRTVVKPAVDANITWLLSHLDPDSRVAFAIDRTQATCHTPRRNQQIDEALAAFAELSIWCARVRAYFLSDLFPAQVDHGLELSAINDRDVFVPVLPLLEAGRGEGAAEELLPAAYANAFLAEQQRSLAAKCLEVAKAFPRNASAITAVDASLLVILLHAEQLCRQFSNGVGYVEGMLRDQLIAAIGKEVTPVEFASYMDFHARKLLRPPYRPRPFSHAVRRHDHDPEGVLSLEATTGASMPDPVSTLVAWSKASRPMTFALDASTRVSFLGDRFLHAFVSHQFSGSPGLALHLVARARQFSSFILLVGRIGSADSFEPKFGIIVQNKDLLKIPILLEQIPTPKEFRDAIASLSPEQQRFAKAFRGMQLESTLFGVCVIHIKPQLEKLLRLPPDSLTKEIKLTQELLGLFIDHQIPSDLLSYDGPGEALALDKLARVKEYAARMQEVIDSSRQRQIDEAREREAFRLAEANRTAHPPPPQAAPMMGGPPGFGPPPPMMFTPPSGAPSAGGPPPGFAPPPAAPPPPSPAPPASPPPAASHSATVSPPPRPTAASAQSSSAEGGEAIDYTRIPGELDEKFARLDEDDALRPTILRPGEAWSRSSRKGLLDAPSVATLHAKEQKEEKNKAFDLLDALTKSGALAIDDASLHVVVAATHCFDETLLDTVIQGNVNPFEKVERSLMIVATTIHRLPARELLEEEQLDRFLTFSPRLDPPESSAPKPLPEP